MTLCSWPIRVFIVCLVYNYNYIIITLCMPEMQSEPLALVDSPWWYKISFLFDIVMLLLVFRCAQILCSGKFNWYTCNKYTCLQGMAASVTTAKKVRVVAIHDFDPLQADAILTQDCLKNPPSIQAQLPLSRGQCLEILTKNVKSWWLYVRCVFSEKEGFIPSTCVVPLREDVDDEK